MTKDKNVYPQKFQTDQTYTAFKTQVADCLVDRGSNVHSGVLSNNFTKINQTLLYIVYMSLTVKNHVTSLTKFIIICHIVHDDSQKSIAIR